MTNELGPCCTAVDQTASCSACEWLVTSRPHADLDSSHQGSEVGSFDEGVLRLEECFRRFRRERSPTSAELLAPRRQTREPPAPRKGFVIDESPQSAAATAGHLIAAVGDPAGIACPGRDRLRTAVTYLVLPRDAAEQPTYTIPVASQILANELFSAAEAGRGLVPWVGRIARPGVTRRGRTSRTLAVSDRALS